MQHKCSLSQGPVAPAGPGMISLHSLIGSSLLTAYELLIGSQTGQDCHLQLPGQDWLPPREQGGSGSAGSGAPQSFNTKNNVSGESPTWAVADYLLGGSRQFPNQTKQF